jgi:predicted RNA binding protein YcfA (HicA-like mRNA interferase family)
MGIDYSLLRSLTCRELIAALKRDGFRIDRHSGSHQIHLHEDGRRVTVAVHHPGATFRPKTLKTMIEDQAKWTEEDMRRLKLLDR